MHPKLLSTAPEWAPFRGCSLLHTAVGPTPGDAPGAAAGLYAAIAAAGEAAGLVGSPGGNFCALPPASYHLTFSDLVHQRSRVAPSAEARLLAGGALVPDDELVAVVREALPIAAIEAADADTLAFEVGGLRNWDDRVAVVELEPGDDPASREAHATLESLRAALDAALLSAFGVRLPPYRPHVSLGYFAEAAAAADDTPRIAAADRLLRDATAGRRFRFGPVRLYLFDDMVHYRAA